MKTLKLIKVNIFVNSALIRTSLMTYEKECKN